MFLRKHPVYTCEIGANVKTGIYLDGSLYDHVENPMQ